MRPPLSGRKPGPGASEGVKSYALCISYIFSSIPCIFSCCFLYYCPIFYTETKKCRLMIFSRRISGETNNCLQIKKLVEGADPYVSRQTAVGQFRFAEADFVFHFGTVLRKTAAFDIIGAIARIRFAALRHFRDIAHITVKRLFFVFLVSRQFVVPIIRFGAPDRPRMSETDRRSVAVAFPECFPPPKRRTETRRDRRARHPRFVHIQNFFRAHNIFLLALNLRAVVQKRKCGARNRAVLHFRIGERRNVRFGVKTFARI